MFNFTVAQLRAVLTIDRYKFHYINALLLSIGVLIPIGSGIYFNQLSLGISAALGALLVGIFNPDEPYPILARSLFASLICISTAALIGLVVSSSPLIIIFVSVFLAGICGFSGVLGPHANVIGMLSLVSFCLFAGNGAADTTILKMIGAIFAGGILQLTIVLSGWLLKTFYPMRRQLANAFYALGDAAQYEPKKLISPALISPLIALKSGIPFSGAIGKTADWLNDLTDQCEILHINFIQLAFRIEHENDDEKKECLKIYCKYLGEKAHRLGETVLIPRHLIFFNKHSKNFPNKDGCIELASCPEIQAIENTMHKIFETLNRPFPFGKSSETGPPRRFDFHPLELIKSNIANDNIFLRHAVRLAIVTPIAWTLGFTLFSAHEFWLPMTVAWIAKPDYVGSVSRILARVVGTILGTVLAGFLLFFSPPDVWLYLAYVFGSIFAFYACLFVNYAVAVFFITTLILFLIRLSNPANELVVMDERIVATIIAGGLMLVASNIKPVFNGGQIIPSFINLLDECKKYVRAAITNPNSEFLHTQPVKAARLKTMALIEAAKYEPYASKLSQERAEKVLMALLEAMFSVLSIQTEASAHPIKSETTLHLEDIERALALLTAKFKDLENGVESTDCTEMQMLSSQVNNTALLALGRAYSHL
jgi:uncharacterized membrane protein YccC